MYCYSTRMKEVVELMSKNVQIPEELFLELCKYHLANLNDTEREKHISEALEGKLDALARRELYSKYKDTSLTDEERERARQEYLDSIGVPNPFRW